MSKQRQPDYQTTKLWEQIRDSTHQDAEAVLTLINSCLPDIEKILADGSGAIKDFTLHDAKHSLRVAMRMAEIIPEAVFHSLSVYENALLLLSAYLHDMGMNPAYKRIGEYREYLLTGEPQDLAPKDIDDFVTWLDKDGRATVPLLEDKERRHLESLQLADELITYYCRDKHNDWSEEWIRANLAKSRLENYPTWMDDLVTVCRSHHEGYEELRSVRFDPIPVGSPAVTVHLRYLAAVLRIADILEFDPERTPEVLLHHRDIAPGSVNYWLKDHHVALEIKGEGRLHITSRPTNAYLHKAIQTMADEINHELKLVSALAKEKPFNQLPISGPDYCWNLQASAQVDIRPKAEAYEYIDGAFRPDTRKLLKLLSGVELYQTPLAAIRELLQNAFDAVREQIALERLEEDDPADATHAERLGDRHRVLLRLDVGDMGVHLTCTDTGVGMSKSIIENHLLVSGSGRRNDVLALERRCQKAGFSVGRTGQFGIGLLSYFMLAKRVIIFTQRSQMCADTTEPAWRFETSGVGSFGELRKERPKRNGTQVELILQPDVIHPNAVTWYRQLREYLVATLIHVPCRFELQCNRAECHPLKMSPGWQDRRDLWTEKLWNSLQADSVQDDEPEFITSLAKRQQEQLKRDMQEIRREFEQSIQWLPDEGMLPDGMGRFRVFLPYFLLPGGPSLVFLRVHQDKEDLLVEPVQHCYGMCVSGLSEMSWRGMSVGGTGKDNAIAPAAVYQIDWTSASAGKLAVSRNDLVLSAQAKRVRDELRSRANELVASLDTDSAYASINLGLVHTERENAPVPCKWIIFPENAPEGMGLWKNIDFPVGYSLLKEYAPRRLQKGIWRGAEVVRIVNLSLSVRRNEARLVHWAHLSPPDFVVDSPDGPLGLWAKAPRQMSQRLFRAAQYPPTWSNVCYICGVWNQRHPLVQAVTPGSWKRALTAFKESLNPLPFQQDLLEDASYAAAWLMLCIRDEESGFWDGLSERAPAFLSDLWKLLFGSRDHMPIGRLDLPYHGGMSVWSSAGIKVVRGFDDPIEYQSLQLEFMPDPGPEWRLEWVQETEN